MQEKTEKIENFATKLAAEIVSHTAGLNDQLRSEFSIATNLPTDAAAHNYLWLEIAFYGSYLINKRIADGVISEDRKLLIQEFKNKIIFYLTTVVFSHEGEDARIFKDYLISTLDSKLQKYSDYRGDIRILFKEELRVTFFKQKKSYVFYKNKIGFLKIKFAFFLAQIIGDNEFLENHKDDFIFPESVLSSLALNITNRFNEIDFENY